VETTVSQAASSVQVPTPVVAPQVTRAGAVERTTHRAASTPTPSAGGTPAVVVKPTAWPTPPAGGTPAVVPGGNERLQWPSDPAEKQYVEELLTILAGQSTGRKDGPETVKLYVMTKHPEAEKKGVWIGKGHQVWRCLESQLPGGRLFGSGCRPKRFYELQKAWEDWRNTETAPMPVHIVH
jgi:hypothetical protein